MDFILELSYLIGSITFIIGLKMSREMEMEAVITMTRMIAIMTKGNSKMISMTIIKMIRATPTIPDFLVDSSPFQEHTF